MTGEELVKTVDEFYDGKPVTLSGDIYVGKYRNGFEFNQEVKEIPRKHNIKTITVPLCRLQDYIGNADLDSNYHRGFTVGRGVVMYFMFIWHSSGTCTVYPKDEKRWPRNLTGNEMITVHFNNN